MAEALTAAGLAGAAGLNAWLPLLIAGLAARWGGLELDAPYDELASTPALVVVGVALVIDVVGDKLPGVDHVLHAVGAVVHPVAGAVLAAGAAGAELPPVAALAAGAVVAGGLHLGRASVRPGSTAMTGGLGNPVLSAIEDALSLALTVLALLLPALAALAVLALVVLLVRRLAARRGRAAP